MTVREMVDLLSDAYAVYELAIRNIDISRMTLRGRKVRLVEILEEEDLNPEDGINLIPHLSAEVDLRISRGLLDELRSLFLTDSVHNSSVIDTRLRFLYARINRVLTVPNSNESHQKDFLTAECERLSNELARVTLPLNNGSVSSSSGLYTTPPNQNIREQENRGSAVWKWDLRFSGDEKQSASEFLQNARDYSHSRGVTEAELLRSISDLLTGSARKWFRTNTVPFSNWTDFVQRFLKDFEPIYESDRLLDSIKKRLQRPDESIIQFFVTMEDLFLRLPRPLNEYDRLDIIRNNLLPRYVSALAVHTFHSIRDLKDSCKLIEAADNILRFRPQNNPTSSNQGSRPPPQNRPYQSSFPRQYWTGQSVYPRQQGPNPNSNYFPQQNFPRGNPGQMVTYVPRNAAPNNAGNFQNRSFPNRQALPNIPRTNMGNNQVQVVEAFPNVMECTSPQFSDQVVAGAMYPPVNQTHQPFFPQVFDQFYPVEYGFESVQPYPHVNFNQYGSQSHVSPTVPAYFNPGAGSVNQLSNAINPFGINGNENTNRVQQIPSQPNSFSSSQSSNLPNYSPNNSSSGNEHGTVGSGSTTAPNT